MEMTPCDRRPGAAAIPDDWVVEYIGDIFDISAGRDLVRETLLPADYGKGSYPIYSNALSNKGLYGYSSTFQYAGNKITVTARGDIGKAMYRANSFSAIGRLLVLSPRGHHDPRYVTEYINNFVEFALESTGVPQLTAPQISKYQVALPPAKAEQEAIAEALSDADALIASVERLLAKKRDIKQGAMQELLTGQRRLPGFEANGGFKDTDVGPLPKDWDARRLGELLEITSSKRVFQSEWTDSGVPFYRARELAVLGSTGSVSNPLFISKEMYDAFKTKHGVPRVGDMLVTGVGTLGKTFVVPDHREFYFKDGNIIWFRVSGKVSSEFLKQLYLSPVITRQIEDAAGGTTVGTYTITGAKKTIIPLPSMDEQQAIAGILSDMDFERRALVAKLDKFRALKQGMMHNLLTGRIRLI